MRERKKKTNDQTENTNRTLIENRLRFKRTTAATTTILRQNTVSNTSASERFAQIILQNTSFSPLLCAPSVGSSTRQACVRNYEYFLVSLSLYLSLDLSPSHPLYLFLSLSSSLLSSHTRLLQIYIYYIFFLPSFFSSVIVLGICLLGINAFVFPAHVAAHEDERCVCPVYVCTIT